MSPSGPVRVNVGPMKKLQPPVPIALFDALCRLLADAAGCAFAPGKADVTEAERPWREGRVDVMRTVWRDGDVEAWLMRETGDNGATHQHQWEAHFHVEAELLLPAASVRFTGGGWGANELHGYAIEAEEGLATRLRAAIEERPVPSAAE